MGARLPIIIVQGAQWGSEAKGMVAAELCKRKRVDLAVRTGAVNAGHTVYWDGVPQKMQQLPTGWVSQNTRLVLGAGTYVNPEILAAEIALVSSLLGEDIRKRLYIDHRVSLHLSTHQQIAKGANRHHLIGATGKGCSVAIVDKIQNRGNGYQLFKEWWRTCNMGGDCPSRLEGLQFADTVDMLHSGYDKGERILLEGTQGTLLDLHLGPYPYTTHKQTQAAEWVTEAGLAPGMQYETVMVARSFPIRVAGNSGPMENETTWPNLARYINKRIMVARNGQGQLVKSVAIEEFENVWQRMAKENPDRFPAHVYDGSVNFDMHTWTPEERVEYRATLSDFPARVLDHISLAARTELAKLFEFTTVTKKLRRVAEWDGANVQWACTINRGTYIILTFWNYWFPETWGQTNFEWGWPHEQKLAEIQDYTGTTVKYITTGPEGCNLLEVAKLRQRYGK